MSTNIPITVHQDAKSYYYASVIIPLAFHEMPRVVRLALSESGWQRAGGDDAMGSLTADLKRSHRESGMSFDYDLRLILNWEPSGEHGERVQLTFSVSDLRKRNKETDCKRRANHFLRALKAKAEQIKRAPKPFIDPNIHPLAEFADAKRLKNKGLFDDPPEPEHSKRFRIGRFEKKIVTLTPSQSEMHQLVCGPTRSGKTTGLFIPNLIERLQTSAIVTEATAGDEPPDLYFKTSGYRAQKGHKIYYFNPDDLYSDRVNPLDQIELGNMTGRQVSSVVKLIMQTTTQDKHTGDQFWTDCERFLLRSLVWHAIGERKKGNGHIGYICDLLQLDLDELSLILASSRMIKAREQFGSFSKKGSEDTRNIVMQALLQRLDLWTEPMTVQLTNATTIDVSDLPNQLFTFYIAMPGHKEELQPLGILLFNWVLQIALEKKFTHPITLLLDEFTNFGYITKMDYKLTTIGHRKIPICMGIQDTVQLKTVYDKYADIFRTQPGTRIFFRPRDGQVAKSISEDLGVTTVVDFEPSGSEIVRRNLQRQLLTRDQLLSLEDKCIVFLPTGGAAQIDFHKPQEYEWATKIPPPPRKKIEIPDVKLFADDDEEQVDEPQIDTPDDDINKAPEELRKEIADLASFINEKLEEAKRLAELGRTDDANLIYQQALESENLMKQVQAKLNQQQSTAKQDFVPKKEEPRKKRPDPWLKDEEPQPKKTR